MMTSDTNAAARSKAVNFTTDGLPLTASEYARLLHDLCDGTDIVDNYSRGGAVAALEQQFAALLGKEAAVFMPTGTLANHLAARSLAGARRRIVVQEASHLYNDSGDCAQQLSGLTLLPLAPGKATFTLEALEELLTHNETGRVATPIGAICVESPVRRLRNEAFDFDELRRIAEEAGRRGIGMHLDGTRLFIASAYSGRSPREYASLFDTVCVSMSKCFNSTSGAILAGPHRLVGDLHHTRRMFGGSLKHAWPDALIAAHYAHGYLERMRAAIAVTQELWTLMNADPRFKVDSVKHGTNVFRLRIANPDLVAVCARLAAAGIELAAPEGDGFWLRVNETAARRSAVALLKDFIDALGG